MVSSPPSPAAARRHRSRALPCPRPSRPHSRRAWIERDRWPWCGFKRRPRGRGAAVAPAEEAEPVIAEEPAASGYRYARSGTAGRLSPSGSGAAKQLLDGAKELTVTQPAAVPDLLPLRQGLQQHAEFRRVAGMTGHAMLVAAHATAALLSAHGAHPNERRLSPIRCENPMAGATGTKYTHSIPWAILAEGSSSGSIGPHGGQAWDRA